MKVTYNWLKDFVEIKLKPEELADKLSMAGLSVASLAKFSDDWVYDIEITSNRPDWLSVRGIAHEVAAITGKRLTGYPVNRLSGLKKKAGKKLNRQTGKPANRLTITIENKQDCKSYYGTLIAGVKVGPSPSWMQKRLESVGLRPVNNVVDITNYCLLETGQPMHAFDADKIVNQPLDFARDGELVEPLTGSPVNQLEIVVRRARENEEIITLDGVKRKLSKDVLVIVSGDDKTGQPANRLTGKPLAIAGIMGGQESEVSAATVNIVLESACFDPVVVRRGTRSAGVSSDSSYRFERGVELANVKAGMDAATALICSLCGGSVKSENHAGMKPAQEKRKILFSLDKACDISGLTLSPAKVKSLLEPLGFGVAKKKHNVFEVTVPFFRRDVNIEADITEEIIRIYGYEAVPLSLPSIRPFSFEAPKVQEIERRVKDTLSALGLKEVITYSLTSDDDYKKSGIALGEKTLTLKNYLSEDFRVLRPTLVASFLNCAAVNIARGQKDLEFFETSRVFRNDADQGGEGANLGVMLCGSHRASWQKESREYSFYDLKGVLEAMLKEFGVKNCVWEKAEGVGWSESGWAAYLIFSGKTLAVLGKVSDKAKRGWGIKIKDDIFIAELSLDALAAAAVNKKTFESIAAIPSITRDISVVAGPQAGFSRIQGIVRSIAKDYLRNIVLLDCYQGKEIPQGSLGLTISLEYGLPEKTLTDAEINPVHQAVLDALVKDLAIVLR